MRTVVVGLALPLALLMMTVASAQTAQPGELLVFVSSFAPAGEGAIQAYRVNPAAGTLTAAQRTPGLEHPFFLAVSPNGRYLYSINAKQFSGTENEQVAAYEVVNRSGELKLLNRVSSRGTASCYLDVDATGRSVLVANYTTGSVASLPVKKDGSLGEAVTFSQHAGSSVNKARQEGPHAHCIVVSPDNRYAYAADLGIDQILSYRLDPKKATLTANNPPFARAPTGAGPRHLTFHPNGKHVYVINELVSSVTLFDYDPKSGILTERQTISTLPKEFKGESYCADVKITPNGRFLYGTNRGHDSIAAYRIGDEGRLSLIEIEPSLGKGPQNLLITPGGEALLCANMPGNNLALFRIDPKSGGLTSSGTPTAIKSPSCIRLLPQGK